jgi:hypothetical protein
MDLRIDLQEQGLVRFHKTFLCYKLPFLLYNNQLVIKMANTAAGILLYSESSLA